MRTRWDRCSKYKQYVHKLNTKILQNSSDTTIDVEFIVEIQVIVKNRENEHNFRAICDFL